MKIWFDVPSLAQSSNECDECHDCSDCSDCPVPYTVQLSSLDSVEVSQHIHTCMLQQARPLYLQACGDDRWLVCNPTDTGQIVVLDSEAFALLEHFHKSTTLSEVMPYITTQAAASTEKTLALFYSLGFLQDIYHPSLTYKNEQSETLSAWLHITNACNLRCHYCYIYKTSEHMDNTIARRAVDAIFRSALRHNYKRVQLKYAGGEASLQMANVLAVHDYASQLARSHRLKLHAYIMSNGVALSQRIIDQLKADHIGVMISLDGIGAHHDSQRPFINGQGSFKYVDRTITRLLASHLMPHINVTVSQRNLDGLAELMGYLLERDLPFTLSYYRDNECSTHLSDLQFVDTQMIAAMRLSFSVIEQHLPKRRLIASLIDKASMTRTHQHTCSVGRNYLVIDQYGGVAKCHADIKHTVTTIDIDDPLQVVREDPQGVQGMSVEDKQECRSCQWRYWCAGGCPLLTYRITGRSDVKSPNCNIYKALFPEALRLEALRLLKYTTPTAF